MTKNTKGILSYLRKYLKEIKEDLNKLEHNLKLHKLKACEKGKEDKGKDESIEAITIDFQKNLPVPNISTNDRASAFSTYDQTVAKKGSNDECSMLYHSASAL